MKRSAAIALLLACGPGPTHGTVISVLPAPSTSNGTPVPVRGRPFEVVMGWHTCALAHGKLHCRETIEPDKPLVAEPPLAGLESLDVTSAAFGRDYGCVTTRAGAVHCYGGNHFGQLGANIRADRHEAPLALPNLRDAKRVYAGPFHACAILNSGKISCWGKNQAGENGSATNYLEAARELVEPRVVEGVDDVTELALAWDSTCAVSSNGTVSCWGRAKLQEEKAHGATNEVPTPVPSLTGATSISANEESFCAIKDEEVICWGQLMMLAKDAARDAVAVIGVKRAKRVSLGSLHGCAVDRLGAVYCFGADMDGQLGIPPVKGAYGAVLPTKVPGIPRAVDVMCGSGISCAITQTDEVWCWGRFNWKENEERTHPAARIRIEQ